MSLSWRCWQEVPTTKQKTRLAAKKSLDDFVKNAVAKALLVRKLNPKGKELDKQKPPRENFVLVKSSVDTKIFSMFGRKPNQRSEFTQQELDKAQAQLPQLVNEVLKEVLGRPKSFLPQLIVEDAKSSHNCRFNKDHRIRKGEKRLTAKEGREKLRYCPVCAVHFLRLDIVTIQNTIAALEASQSTATPVA